MWFSPTRPGFESRLGNSRLAQLVERKTLNLVVVGSSPTVGVASFFYFYFFRFTKIKIKMFYKNKNKNKKTKNKNPKLPDRELNPGLVGESHLS